MRGRAAAPGAAENGGTPDDYLRVLGAGQFTMPVEVCHVGQPHCPYAQAIAARTHACRGTSAWRRGGDSAARWRIVRAQRGWTAADIKCGRTSLAAWIDLGDAGDRRNRDQVSRIRDAEDGTPPLWLNNDVNGGSVRASGTAPAPSLAYL